MRIYFCIIAVLLFSACSQVTELADETKSESLVEEDIPIQDLVVEQAVDEVVDLPNYGYKIYTEKWSEEEIKKADLISEVAYSSALYYGDTKLFDLPFEDSNGATQPAIAHVFKGDENDIVFLTTAGQCAGCEYYRTEYYVVNTSDHYVEGVPFAGPPVGRSVFKPSSVTAGTSGDGSKTLYSDVSNELAYLVEYGDFEISETYYEEIWVYHFDKKEWALEKTTNFGETVQCNAGMGFDLGFIYYSNGALVISPVSFNSIEKIPYCEY